MAQAKLIRFPAYGMGASPAPPSPTPPAPLQTSGRMVCRRYPLAAGDAGVARTIQFMRALATGNEGAANPQIRQKATEITQDVANRDITGEIQALFAWVKKNIKFRGEFKEFIQSPLITLQLQAGDCDDHATLLAALLATLGIRSQFKTIATSGDQFSHVYLIAYDPKSGAAIPLDTTVAESMMGWEPRSYTRARQWKPMGDAATGLTPGVADAVAVLDKFTPLIQAGAVRLAYGDNAGLYPFQQTFSSPSQIAVTPGGAVGSLNLNTVSPTTITLGALGALALLAFVFRRH